MEAVSLSGKHTVPWSNLWQRVILASSTSGPGWSSTCLHHCRGLRTFSSCALDLGLTYSLECTIWATILSWDLTGSFKSLQTALLYILEMWRDYRQSSKGKYKTKCKPMTSWRRWYPKIQMQTHRSKKSKISTKSNCQSEEYKSMWLLWLQGGTGGSLMLPLLIVGG